MSTKRVDPDSLSGTAALTIRLSTDHMRALRHLGEVFHATTERMVVVWAAYQIERLMADRAHEEGSDPAPQTSAPDS